ncbi:MAG: diacylglycerol kinase family protein [Bacteroidota bacterium]
MDFQKRIKSFKYALNGIRLLFSSQANARIHLSVALAVVIAGFLYRISTTEWLTIILCISLVIGMEAMNTAVEWLTDLVSPEYHPLAGKVKDVAAAAVLITVIGAVVAGLIIFIPRIS